MQQFNPNYEGGNPQYSIFGESSGVLKDSFERGSLDECCIQFPWSEGGDGDTRLLGLVQRVRLDSDDLWRQVLSYVDDRSLDVNLFDIEEIRARNEDLEAQLLLIRGAADLFGRKYPSVLLTFSRIFSLKSFCELFMGLSDVPKANSTALKILNSVRNYKKIRCNGINPDLSRVHEEIALYGLLNCISFSKRTLAEAVLLLNIIRGAVKGRLLFPGDDLSMVDSCASLYVLSEYSGIFYRPGRLSLESWYLPLSPVLESILLRSSDAMTRADLVEELLSARA